MKQLLSGVAERIGGLFHHGPPDVDVARARELEFQKRWRTSDGGVSDDEWIRQNHALFVALSGAEPHRSRLAEIGIDAFIPEIAETAADEFERLWGKPLAGRRVLDIGCGSRLRTAVFARSSLTAIDPLLREYRGINEASFDLPNIAATYSEPAETRLPELVGTQDLILCWNVLDHCTDWKRALVNCTDYLAAGGRMILGTDCDVSDQIHASIAGGGRAIVSLCRRRGVHLESDLPAAALSRDWAGIFVKRAEPNV